MGDQTVNNDITPPAGVSKSESPSHGVTVVATSAPKEIQAPLPPTGEEKSQEDEDDGRSSSAKTPGQLIREIKKDLDELWEAQRESIIASIKNEKLGQKHEHTRKQRREILGRILTNAQDFWLQTGRVKKWIRELTLEEDGELLDYKHKFPVAEDGHEQEKFDDLCRWLEKKALADRPGCYCFKRGQEYLYIGRAAVLCDRIKQHEDKTYFTYSNGIRVVIPRHKQKLEELERLLILVHTREKQKPGDRGGTPLDDLLGFLEREVREVTEDAARREL
jgi:hypothetical protein